MLSVIRWTFNPKNIGLIFPKKISMDTPLVSDRKGRKKFNKYITYMVDKGGETICRFCKYQLSCSLRNETDCYRVVENKTCHDFLRIYTQGVTCQATDVALPLRGSRTRAIHCSRERERESGKKEKKLSIQRRGKRWIVPQMQVLRGNFKIDLVPLFVSRGGKNTGEESSFYRVGDYNADSVHYSFFLLPSVWLELLLFPLFSPPPPFSQLSTSRRVVLFFFFFSLHVSIMQLSAFHFQ